MLIAVTGGTGRLGRAVVEDLLRQMTLSEKVGQMDQILVRHVIARSTWHSTWRAAVEPSPSSAPTSSPTIPSTMR